MSQTIAKVLLGVGGIFGLVNGFVDFTGMPLAGYLFGLFTGLGMILYVLGVLGVIGGILTLYFGLVNPKKTYALVGSVLAILGVCGFAVLALIGALLMKE